MGNGTLVPVRAGSMVGRTGHRTGTPVPGAANAPDARRRGSADSRYRCVDAPRGRASVAVLARRACRRRLRASAGARRSTRPARAPPTARAPGRLPGPRGARPDDATRTRRPRRSTPGGTARPTNLGRSQAAGINEVRFAGGTWTFGAERAAVLAVFTAPGLTADAARRLLRAERPAREPDQDHRRVTSRPSPAGRATGSTRRPASGTQTVVVWPAADAGPGQRRHHQRPAGRPDRRRRRRPSAAH